MKTISLFKGWRWQCCTVVLIVFMTDPLFAISHVEEVAGCRLSVVGSGIGQVDSCRLSVVGDPSFVGMTIDVGNKARKPQQQQNISGIVSDQNGPLLGVTISVKGGSAVAISDQNGKYSIAALPNDILVFTFVGYKTLEMPVNGQVRLNAILAEDATALQEVTVNAGYYKVKDKERTGSITTIKAADIAKQPVTNVLATMQGRMAGVDILQESGMPGSEFQIKIRGINSLRADGNAPLYIINGVPFSSETIGSQDTSGNSPSLTSPLNSINPADIESIEILKDADATAIYGSRGANGVVLITTKRGKAGKTRFSVDASTGVGKVAKFMDLLDTPQYIAMREQAFASDGVETLPDWAYDVNGTWARSRDTDWQKELIGGTAEISMMQASVSGGSVSTQYLLSGNYRTETTVMPGNYKYGKGSAHFNMNHRSDDEKFGLIFSANYIVQKNTMGGMDMTGTALSLAPNAPELYDSEGNLNWENSTWVNPLAALESKSLRRTNNLIANTVLSYNFLPNLQIKSSFGYNDVAHQERLTFPHTIYDPSYGLDSSSSSLYTGQTGIKSWIAEPQLHWTLNTSAGKFETLVGGTFQEQRTTRFFALGSGFASNSLIYDMASASIRAVQRSDETTYKYHAVFARLNYNYDGRYIVNLTGRRDGSSRFGPGKQFANFGAFGAAWIFSNESMLKDNKVLSFGKLRTSYGITGNDQIGDYQFLDTYASSGSGYAGINGLQPSRLFNPAFGWESNRKFEAALETGFFRDRIFFTAAWYLNRSSDQLVGIPLPGTTGFTTLNANLDATVENRGVEFTLRTVNFESQHFGWTTSLNVSKNKNELISFPGLETSSYVSTYIIGQSLNIRKLYHYTGINPETGIYEFEDVNGDGVITSLGDRNRVVDFTPDYFGGIENQFRYKGLRLDFLFQFVKQQRMAPNLGVPGVGNNQLAGAHNAWQQPGDTSENQILTVGFNGAATQAYDRFNVSDASVVDASYIKLRNVSLTYDLPLTTVKGITCRLFLQGQNLLTFSRYKSSDPEFKFGNSLPPLRVISSGVQLTF